MSQRYEDADNEAVALFEEIRAEYFPWTDGALIKFLFDTRKKTQAGMICLGYITKGNDMLRFFSRKEAGAFSGYDYVICVDKMAWGGIERTDRIRILRHELRHIRIDHEKADPYGIMPHDVQDFKIEIGLNADDPDWSERVASIALHGYQNQKDGVHPYQGEVPGSAPPASQLNPGKQPKRRYALKKSKTAKEE